MLGECCRLCGYFPLSCILPRELFTLHSLIVRASVVTPHADPHLPHSHPITPAFLTLASGPAVVLPPSPPPSFPTNKRMLARVVKGERGGGGPSGSTAAGLKTLQHTVTFRGTKSYSCQGLPRRGGRANTPFCHRVVLYRTFSKG